MKRELITDDDVAIGLLRLAYACMTKTDAREANPKTIIKKVSNKQTILSDNLRQFNQIVCFPGRGIHK